MKKLLLFFASAMLFSWQANAQSCASPTGLSSGTALTGQTTCGTAAALTNNPCNGSYVSDGTTSEAHIYSYTTGANPESIVVDFTNIGTNYSGITIVSGTCDDASATCLGSYYTGGGTADGQATVASVPAATTIYVYVTTWPAPNCVASYDLLLTSTPISCADPSAVAATNVMATSADLSWTSGGGAQSMIEWGTAGFAQGSGTLIDAATSTNPYALTGLTENTAYEFYVRELCSATSSDLIISGVYDGPLAGGTPKGVELYVINDIADMSIYGLESANNGGGSTAEEFTFPADAYSAGDYIYVSTDSVNFNTFFGFDPNYNDGSMGINGDDAVVLFENGVAIDAFGDVNTDGTGTAWEYADGWAYRNNGTSVSTTFDDTEWTYGSIAGETDNATAATPMPTGSFMTPGSDMSNWVGPVAFTTPCAIITPDYTTDYTTFLPACWNEADGGDVASGPATLGAGGWGQRTTYNPSGSAVINLYNSDDMDWLLSPQFDLSAGGYEVVVEVALTDYFSAAADADGMTGTDDEVQLLYTEDGTTWNNITTWNDANQPNETGSVETFALISTGTNVQFAIWASEGAIDDAPDYDFHVNSFIVRTPPACLEPTALNSSNVMGTSADFGWTDNAGETEWAIEYDTAGFAPGTGTMIASTTTNPTNVTGLTPNTAYEFYVRAICGAGDSSIWVGPSVFTTPCAIFTPDLSEEFDAYLPDCWEEMTGQIDGALTGSTSSWGVDGFANVGTTGAVKNNMYTTTVGQWFISPSIDLGAGNGYQLEFDVAAMVWNSTTAPAVFEATDTLAVVISTDNGTTWTSANILQIWEQGTEPSVAGDYFAIDLSSYSGVVKFGFYAVASTSTASDFDVFFDNFKVRTPPTCLDVTALGSYDVLQTTANIFWTDNAGATGWEYEYGTTGFTQGSGTLVSATNDTAALSGLTADTDYEFYVRAVCAPGNESAWIGPVSFFTGYCTASPTSVDGVGITNVTMGTINNTTVAEAGNYGDYSAQITDAQQTTNLTIDITLETGFTYNLWAWVDWNDDLDFTGTDEVYYLGESLADNPTTYNGVISVPATAALGNHRIRIGGADSGLGTTSPSNPCYTGAWASFEDYTINVTLPPACAQPTVLGTDNLLGTTTDILWMDNASGSSWEYEYGAPGFVQGTGTSAIVANDTTSLGGLTALTDYEFYVRVICAANDSSAWSGPFAFTTITDCTPADVSAAAINDCVAGTYDVEFTVVDLGDAATLYISDGIDTLGTITSTGTTSVGPFTGGSAVSLSLLHDTDTLCDLGPVTLVNAACNDTLCDAITLAVGGTPLEFSNVGTTGEVGEPEGSCWFGTGTQNSVWFDFVAPANGEVTVSTDFANTSLHDTHIAIYELPGGDCTDLTDLVEVGCSEDEGSEGPSGWTSITTMTGLTAGTTYYLQVDGYGTATGVTFIEVTSPCNEPSALMVSNETDNSADVSWTAGGSETEWEIEYGLTGFTPGTGMTMVTTSNPATISGLDEDAEYEFYVSSICGVGDTSGYSLVDTITTMYLCDDVSAVGVANITASTMDVSWTDNAGVGAVNIEYGPAGFTPGTGTTEAGTTSPYTISGLMAETAYDVYVTVDCGANGMGNAVGPFSASTVESCPGVTGVMTSNATASSVDVSWTDNAGASAWEIEYVANGGAQGSGTVVSATSNPFTVTGLMENTSYEVYVRSICGAGDESAWIGGAGTGFMTGESCPDPTNLTTTNIASNSADFGWTENGTATAWSIEYGPVGFTPGTGTVVGASSNPFSVSGLAAGTTYSFVVKSLCIAGTDESNFSAASAGFSTLGTDIVSLGNGQSVNVYSYDNNIVLSFDNVAAPTANVVVYDIVGQMVANESMATVGTQKIELNTVTTGFYLVKMDIDKATNTIKVFIDNE